MVKSKSDFSIDPRPSPGMLDGRVRLMAGVVVQACKDLRSPNPLESLDALDWLLDPMGAAVWIDALLGVELKPYSVLVYALGGKGETYPETKKPGWPVKG